MVQKSLSMLGLPQSISGPAPRIEGGQTNVGEQLVPLSIQFQSGGPGYGRARGHRLGVINQFFANLLTEVLMVGGQLLGESS